MSAGGRKCVGIKALCWRREAWWIEEMVEIYGKVYGKERIGHEKRVVI